jgi:hypothetical protein
LITRVDVILFVEALENRALGVLLRYRDMSNSFSPAWLTDKNGRSLTLTTNPAGNLYTAEPLALPLQEASIERSGEVYCMLRDIPDGSCNACHSTTPRWAAPGTPRSP